MLSTPSLSYSTRLLMDPPPLPPHPTTIVNPNPDAIATTRQLSNSELANNSPRSYQTDNWDEPLPPVPGAKLRLMCSYGGHIIPRPHDKALCYVGGETRIVVVDRNSSLSDLHFRLSRTLLNGRKFTLKYQLPSEELDSLISVTTDEDLENMIEEYDRTMSSSPLKPSRLRLFLFLAKPETAASMGALLDDAKSETWFVDALNGADLLHRGVSDSAAIDNLLEFDGMVKNDSCTDLEAQNNESMAGNNQVIKNVDQEVHLTMPDSPMVETTSSFDSSLSSPSMANLPAINVRIEDTNARLHDHMTGLDEQFSQMKVASSAQHSFPTDATSTAIVASAGAVNSTAVITGDNLGRIISDDERSDKGILLARRKPPLPLQSVQRKFTDPYSLPSPDSKHAGGYNLQSPDSVASDSSIASAASLSKHTMYQDPSPVANHESRVSAAATDLNNNIANPGSQIYIQQAHDPVVLPPLQQNQQQQQQFVHASTQYIQHPATGLMPISSYYPMYAAPTQQPFHQQIDQQYPMYYLPVPHTQPYHVAQQSNIADATALASSRPLPPPNPPNVPSSAAYMETVQPVYTAKTTTSSNPETAADVYGTTAAPAPTLVQVPPNQFQQQYFGLSQLHPPNHFQQQFVTAASAATANYGFNYPHPTHDQLNYAQHPPTQVSSQYQTMTPATAVLVSQAADNTTQQVRTSQP